MKLPYGFHRDLPYAEYDKLDGIRFSRLKKFDKSPLAFRHNCDNPNEPTEAMIMGSHLHTAILQPHLSHFTVFHGRRQGKDWEAFREGSQSMGSTVITEAQAEVIVGATKAVWDHEPAARYLKRAATEVTMFWRDPVFKRDCKARLDAWKEDGEETFLVSLKKAADVSEKWFGRQYADLCYHAQDAFYQSGFFHLNHEMPKMVTIAVEPKQPHEVAVYTIGNEILRLGQQKIGEWIMKLEICEKSGKWPGAIQGEQELTLPSWAFPQGDFELDDIEAVER